MTIELAVILDEEQKSRLDAIAAAREETMAAVLREAVVHYLDYDAWFRAEVQKGVASADQGELRDLEDVMANVERLIASYE
jgi:predicted transcriptional regulator